MYWIIRRVYSPSGRRYHSSTISATRQQHLCSTHLAEAFVFFSPSTDVFKYLAYFGGFELFNYRSSDCSVIYYYCLLCYFPTAPKTSKCNGKSTSNNRHLSNTWSSFHLKPDDPRWHDKMQFHAKRCFAGNSGQLQSVRARIKIARWY